MTRKKAGLNPRCSGQRSQTKILLMEAEAWICLCEMEVLMCRQNRLTSLTLQALVSRKQQYMQKKQQMKEHSSKA